MGCSRKEETQSDCGGVSPLRHRMIEDMQLAGLSEGTQRTYISVVVQLQKVAGCRPDRLTEEQVRRYLLWLRDSKDVAKGTFQPAFFGLKFFYHRTLDLDWSLFTKKKCVSPSRSGSRWPYPGKTAVA